MGFLFDLVCLAIGLIGIFMQYFDVRYDYADDYAY